VVLPVCGHGDVDARGLSLRIMSATMCVISSFAVKGGFGSVLAGYVPYVRRDLDGEKGEIVALSTPDIERRRSRVGRLSSYHAGLPCRSGWGSVPVVGEVMCFCQMPKPRLKHSCWRTWIGGGGPSFMYCKPCFGGVWLQPKAL